MLEGFEPAQQQTTWSEPLEFTHSVFALSHPPIDYYQTSVKLSDLEDYFEPVEDIPGSAHWGYHARFQRVLEQTHIDQELLQKYLLQPEQCKFFNPLTIALLPFDAQNNTILHTYPHGSKMQDQTDEHWTVECIGAGIEIKTLKNATVGHIRWNRATIRGVVIDGQHRLSALIKYANDRRRPQNIDLSAINIPVVLLVFHPASDNILAQVRELFKDLNKHVRSGNQMHQLLLDDRNIAAALTRDLVQDTDNPEGIRYEVIDWQSETPATPATQAYHLTSMVALYDIITYLFDKPIMLDTQLDLNKELVRRRIPPIDVNAAEWTLHEEQISIARERFRNRHKRFILDVFTHLPPFKAFLDTFAMHTDTSREDGTVLQEYIFKPPHKREPFKQALRKRGRDPEKLVDEPLRKLQQIKDDQTGAELLFYPVGQRALFAWFYYLQKIYNSAGYEDFAAIATAYGEDLALLISNDFFAKDKKMNNFFIWQGICLRGDKVNPSKAAADRIGAFILLAIAAIRLGVDNVETASLTREVNLKKAIRAIVREYTKRWAEEEEDDDEAIKDETGWQEEDSLDTLPEDMLRQNNEERAKATLSRILAEIRTWHENIVASNGVGRLPVGVSEE